MKLQRAIINAVLCFVLFLSAACATENATGPLLKDVFAKDFLIGAALNYDQIAGKKPNETAIVIKYFNTITPENILKWESVHPGPDKYNFEPADKYVDFGEKNKMFIVGHTLVWHNQTPNWVFQDATGKNTDRETLLTRMKDHISTVVGRYKGRINGWDVVNEAVGDDGQMRKTKWFEIIGEEYVAKAFEFARQADPNAELYYNDYDLWKRNNREGVIRLVKDLQAKGIRVDGIGMQGHWGLDYPPLNELEDSIRAFSELGVKLMITEMDITILPSAWDQKGADISLNFELSKKLNPYPDALPDEMQEKLAKRYAELFAIFYKYRDKFSRVTFWGVQDGNSWRNSWPVKGRSDYPLLFDRNCQPKPAFDAVVKTARGED
jgi:endo-1,4-beta-xylanase